MPNQTKRDGRAVRVLARLTAWLFGAAVFAVYVTTPIDPGFAQPNETGSALSLLLDGDGPLAIEDRKKLATHLAEACGTLSRKIPTLSPRESDWLNAEIEAGKLERDRLIEALASIEFAKRQAKHVLDACATNALTLSQTPPSNVEMLTWAFLISHLMDYNLPTHIGALRGSDVGGISDEDDRAVSLFATAAKWIVDRVLIPQLTDKLVPTTASQ